MPKLKGEMLLLQTNYNFLSCKSQIFLFYLEQWNVVCAYSFPKKPRKIEWSNPLNRIQSEYCQVLLVSGAQELTTANGNVLSASNWLLQVTQLSTQTSHKLPWQSRMCSTIWHSVEVRSGRDTFKWTTKDRTVGVACATLWKPDGISDYRYRFTLCQATSGLTDRGGKSRFTAVSVYEKHILLS